MFRDRYLWTEQLGRILIQSMLRYLWPGRGSLKGLPATESPLGLASNPAYCARNHLEGPPGRALGRGSRLRFRGRSAVFFLVAPNSTLVIAYLGGCTREGLIAGLNNHRPCGPSLGFARVLPRMSPHRSFDRSDRHKGGSSSMGLPEGRGPR